MLIPRFVQIQRILGHTKFKTDRTVIARRNIVLGLQVVSHLRLVGVFVGALHACEAAARFLIEPNVRQG